MGTLVQESDIDQFIRGHKTKLQQERNHLNQYTDQSRYPGGQQVTSPSSRKQWDKSQAQGKRPAEERRAPTEPEETGLQFNDGEQEKKRQQLQAERKQEYNDILAQRGQKLRRRPRTPSQEGLPLGQYERQRKAYEAERQQEMKQAMESKKKLQGKRHIVTPEQGMFIGPDQSERDKQFREKNRKNQQALEEQQREQLLFKARQHGQIPEHTPRKGAPPNQQDPSVLYKPPPPPTPPPAVAGQRSDKGQRYEIEERVMDMPKVSPRRNDPLPPEPKVAFMPDKDHSPRRLPIYMEDKGKGHERPRGPGQPEHYRDEIHDRRYDRLQGERGRREDRQQYRPPAEVRRSRSLSPPAERRRDRSPEEMLEEQRHMIDKLKQRQQILQEEYKREIAEEQRLASEREGLPLGVSDRQKLDEERKREYNEYLAKKGPQGSSRRADVLEGTGATLPVGEYDDRRRQQLNSERAREYHEHQQQKLATQRQRGLPPKPPTPNHFFKNIGQHERQQQVLNEERKKEYNQKLTEERGRTAGRGNYGAEPPPTGLPLKNSDSAEVRIGKDVYATLPGLHYSDSAEARKMRARNEEYNEYLREKQWKDAHRFDNKKPATDAPRRHSEPSSPRGKKEYATLPGLHYTDSAEKRKVQERNKEYNEFLRQKQSGGKKGWATPSYEEILEQKRREEAFRRQEDDYEPVGMRRYASEGAINKLQNDFRDRELDKEFEARKVRFGDEFKSQRGGILEDDDWLNPEQRREQEYKQLAEQPARVDFRDDMAARVRQQPAFLASLPLGGAPGLGAGQDERDSAKKRRQGDYRRELQLQMEEAKAAKRREKVQGLPVNASGYLDPEKSSNRMRGLEGQPGVSPRREYKAKEVQAYHTKFLLDDSGDYDALGRRPGEHVRTAPANVGQQGRIQGLGLGDLSSLGLGSGDDLRLDLGGGGGGLRERGRRRDRDAGLLDPGFAGLLDSRRPLGTANPPPGLVYQPSTYVTGGGGIGGPYSSVDEAYNYYAMKNPLDIDNGVGGGGIPFLNLGGDYGGGGPPVRGSPTPRVTFADEPPTTRRRDRSKERISPYQFPSDDDNRSRSRSETQNYGAELERQIQEKRMQKLREKEEQERYERKLEQEIASYNPFGRSGGGAPIKNEHGQAIADLRSLQRGGGPGSYVSPRREVSPTYSPRPPSPRDDKIRTPPPQQTAFGEATHARGGHGIFGRPKTEAEKDVSEKYKDELREQIAEKRRREQMEKERERMEEEKENRRLEEQRLRMQSEYEAEQNKIRAREEETRRKNEELKKQAEEKKKEADRKRREADDARMREQQEQIDREKREREQHWYPPEQNFYAVYQQASPAPGPSSNRPNSSDVLTQLASMRKQLQSERKRVENALENSKNDPDVFDPRLVQKPPPNKLIFENAVNKNASLPPPRAQTTDMANARNIQQFNELKFKADTDSRRAFRSMFPEAPVTNTTLEAQQDAMLRQQEEQLRALRDRNVEGVNHFPEDFEDMAGARNDSARARRRERFSPRPLTNNEMGSQASLDIDRIQRKNEERLRRLNNMTTAGDDVSVGDPDDILNRFMAQQRYNRRSVCSICEPIQEE